MTYMVGCDQQVWCGPRTNCWPDYRLDRTDPEAPFAVQGPNTDLPPVVLQHVGARWYDGAVGRFLQRDPIGVAGGINPYLYCAGNPVTFVDPSGRLGLWGAAGGAIIGGVVGGLTGGGWQGALAGALGGAVAGATGGLLGGAVTGAGSGMLVGGLSGAAGGLVSTGAENLLRGRPWHSNICIGTGFGALGGALTGGAGGWYGTHRFAGSSEKGLFNGLLGWTGAFGEAGANQFGVTIEQLTGGVRRSPPDALLD